MRRKVLFAFFVVCIGVLLFGTISALAETYGDYTYEVENGEVTITGFKSTPTVDEIEIPKEIEGYPVTCIGDNAFYFCAGLKSVKIPDSVTSIGKYSFYRCIGLESIEIPDSVTSIGENAFLNCSGLTSVIFPDSVTSIGECAFFNCTNIKDVYISDIAAWCNINFNIYSNPIWYGGNLYLNNELVEHLVISDSVISIGDHAFYKYKNLKSVTIGDSVTSIGDFAFDGCSNLKSVTIGDSVINIGDYAFRECSSLTSVATGDSVTNIGWYAFDGCNNLETVTIGKSVTNIGDCAFVRCEKLTDVYYKGTEDEWNKISIASLNENLINATIHFNSKNPIRVIVNGKKVAFDQAPVLENDRTLVPLRAIFEALGAAVEWDNDTQTVTSQKGNTKISLQIGSTKMYVNESEKILDVPAKLMNDRTLVPVRAISEAFGCNVDWEDETQTVIITGAKR